MTASSKSILDPFCCGVGKICLLESSDRSEVNKNNSVSDVSKVLMGGFESFVELMKDGVGFDVKYDWFRFNSKRIKLYLVDLGKASKENKQRVKDHFGSSSWVSLSVEQRKRHSLYKCKECLCKEKNRSVLCLFPIKKAAMQKNGSARWFNEAQSL